MTGEWRVSARIPVFLVSIAVLVLVFTVHSQDGLQIGYAVIQAEDNGQVPMAAALFALRVGDVLISEAAVGGTTPIRRGRIFVDQDGAETGLALVNPSLDESVRATLLLRNSLGMEECFAFWVIEPGGHLARNVEELFSGTGCSLPPTGSLTFETEDADQRLAGITLRQSRNLQRPVLATLPVVNLDDASATAPVTAGASIVFPHIGAGLLDASTILCTQVILINPTDQPIGGEIRLFDDQGDPLPMELDQGSTATSFPYALEPDGTFLGTLTSAGGLSVGYAVVTLDEGDQLPNGTAVFQYREKPSEQGLSQAARHLGGIISEAGVGAVPATRTVRIFVDTIGTKTGVAVAVPGTEDAMVDFELLDRNGLSIQTVKKNLRAGSYLAKFIDELGFSKTHDLASGFSGLMEIRSNVPLHPITLKFTQNGKTANQPILTTLPLADSERPIEANSLILPHLGFGSTPDGLGLSTRLILINQDRQNSAAGSIRFARSMDPASGDGGIGLVVPGTEASQHPYRIPAGGSRRLWPGNTAPPVSIVLPTVPGSEVAVATGRVVSIRPQVLDSANELRDDFEFEFFSLDCQVASVDDLGWIEGKAAGFSTLIVSAGGIPLPNCGDGSGVPPTGGDVAPQGAAPGLLSPLTITVTETGSGLGAADVRGVLQDGAGRVYLSSSEAHAILRAPNLDLEPEPFAGRAKESGLEDGPRLNALFNRPSFLSYANGIPAVLYVSDSGNNLVRRVEVDPVRDPFEGAVSILRLTEKGGDTQGLLHNPQGIALDGRGNLWVADAGSRTIRRIALMNQEVETIAGQATASGCQDGAGDQARFTEPIGIAKIPNSATQLLPEVFGVSDLTFLVADQGCNSLRLILQEDAEGRVWRVDTVESAISASRQGNQASSAQLRFNQPIGVAVDPSGNIFVSEAETGQLITLLTTGEVVQATQLEVLSSPKGLSITRAGSLLVADQGAAREIVYGAPEISEISELSTRGGEVTVRGKNFAPDSILVVQGEVIRGARVENTSTIKFTARQFPSGRGTLTIHNRGGLAQAAFPIQPVALEELSVGQITTVAGSSVFSGDTDPAVQVVLSGPKGLALDSSANFFFADSHSIRKVEAATGRILTVAGIGKPGFSGDGEQATAAALNGPSAVAVDGSGNLFIADRENHVIRKVDAGTGKINTVVGTGKKGLSGDGGPADSAQLSFPGGVSVDASGNLFIADTFNDQIRRVEVGTNTITKVAGSRVTERCMSLIGCFPPPCQNPSDCGDGGSATMAKLNLPSAVAVDAFGNLFIADTDNNRIRMVNASTSIITTVAGTGVEGFSGDGESATTAALAQPFGVVVDSAQNIYIADTFNNRIRIVEAATGVIDTVAGTGLPWSPMDPLGDGDPATEASLGLPRDVAIDGVGNLFITDVNNRRIRKVEAATGLITTVAGSTAGDFLGDDGPATTAQLNSPVAVSMDRLGNLYIADQVNHRVRKVEAATGRIITVAGTGPTGVLAGGFSGDGGPATKAELNSPSGVAADESGNLFIADTDNDVIRKVESATGTISTVAGGGNDLEDGVRPLEASLDSPMGIALDAFGNLFIADTNHNQIRKFDMVNEIITIVAGTGCTGELGSGCEFVEDGPAKAATLNSPTGVAVDAVGNLFIADTRNSLIRKVDASSGNISNVAGGGQNLPGDGDDCMAAFLAGPASIVVDGSGNFFFSDAFCVRRCDAVSGIITTVAGTREAGFSGDGGLAKEAALSFPVGVALDSFGNLFIADRDNNRIRFVRGPLR